MGPPFFYFWLTIAESSLPNPYTGGEQQRSGSISEARQLARVAKSADAKDLKSFGGQPSCGFKSHPGHHVYDSTGQAFANCCAFAFTATKSSLPVPSVASAST
jgi:hypothetical protein